MGLWSLCIQKKITQPWLHCILATEGSIEHLSNLVWITSQQCLLNKLRSGWGIPMVSHHTKPPHTKPNPQSNPPDFKGSNPPNSPCFTADKKASYAALTVYIGFAGASTCFYATPRARILWFYGSARGAEWSNLCHIQHYDFIASHHPAPQNAFSSDPDKPYMDSSWDKLRTQVNKDFAKLS